ncbi:hypothetical protein [Catenulispora sp. EB89]|uniref:hypothetical protein n=1 Tax=Catenulispora sp. EB89 TaxID=3156257 RepID=UPI0035135CF4
MEPFVLVLRRGQRRRLLACASGCVLAAAVCAVLSFLHVFNGGRSQFTVPLLGVVALVNAVVLGDSAFGRTVVSDVGITLWRPLRRRTVGWGDVDSFEDRESGDGDVSRVVLVTRSGSRRALPAPMNASWGRDDDLGARVRDLRARLEFSRSEIVEGRGMASSRTRLVR